jgi:hypothetical protein
MWQKGNDQAKSFVVATAGPRTALALDELIGFESRHFEDLAQRIEPIATRDLGKLLRQRGNILRRLIRGFPRSLSRPFRPLIIPYRATARRRCPVANSRSVRALGPQNCLYFNVTIDNYTIITCIDV